MRTKKDHILALARQDPFLRVEEIAAVADTTPRYVRTTLSEARLSLLTLRRKYARKMKQRLEGDAIQTSAQRARDVCVIHRTPTFRHVRVVNVVDPDVSRLLAVEEDRPLLKVSRVQLVHDRPRFVHALVTHKDLVVGEDIIHDGQPLRRWLGLEIPGKTRLLQNSIEVEKASPDVAESLGLDEDDAVVKYGRVIETAGEKVGVEYVYADAYAVRITFQTIHEDTLQIEEKMSGWDKGEMQTLR